MVGKPGRKFLAERKSMYQESVDAAAQVGSKKAVFLRKNPLGYFIASMLAGIYVGLGIILIFSVGAPFAAAGSPAVKLVMGASFTIALTLVVFAGSELFTGNTMYLTFSCLGRQTRIRDLLAIWSVSWIGNLAGSLALAWLVVVSGSIDHAFPMIGNVTAVKMSVTPTELIGRGLLCNLLVCLALWTAGRTRSDAAKIMLIGLCLFAFIGSGFEHSIANMSLLGIGLFAQAGEGISWGGYFYNLLWVTFGNILGGAVVLAGAYHLASRKN
jgi:nitrite transporter NirC